MAIFSYDKGVARYHYGHVEGTPPTAFHLHWGVVGTATPYTYTITPPVYDGLVTFRAFLPGAGEYEAYMHATNGTQDWAATALQTFTVTATGPGQARVLLFVL